MDRFVGALGSVKRYLGLTAPVNQVPTVGDRPEGIIGPKRFATRVRELSAPVLEHASHVVFIRHLAALNQLLEIRLPEISVPRGPLPTLNESVVQFGTAISNGWVCAFELFDVIAHRLHLEFSRRNDALQQG